MVTLPTMPRFKSFQVRQLVSLVLLCVLCISIGSTQLVSAAKVEYTEEELRGLGVYFVDQGVTGSGSASCSQSSQTSPVTAAGGNNVYIIGDSLTVGMRDSGNLVAKLTNAGWNVTDPNIEATTGINIDDSIPKITANANNAVSQANLIIVGLGTNRTSNQSASIDNMMSAIRGVNANAQIDWVNAYSTKTDYSDFNTLLTQRQSANKINKVLDWAQEAQTNSGNYNLASDSLGIHTDAAGYIKRSEWLVSGIGTPGSGSNTSNTLGCCPAGSTSLTGSTPAEQVWNYFIGKGLNNIQVAGVMGNLQQESNFRAEALNPTSGAYGIGQWLGGRLTKLKAIANSGDLSVQLDYMWSELDGSYKTSVLDPLMAAADLKTAVNIWLTRYEIPCNPQAAGSCDAELTIRLAKATVWENQASGGGSSATNAAVTGTDTSGCSGNSPPSGANGYSNPFHDMTNIVQSRIDEGVDYAAKPGTTVPIYAMGTGIVDIATTSSSFYRTKLGNADWITYHLTEGPATGLYIYISEGCPNITVHATEQVTSSTHLCDMGPDSIEMGWAQNGSIQNPAAYNVYQEGNETAYGVNFNDLLVSLGAPAGHLDTQNDPGGTVLGSLPPNWPAWK